MAASDKDFLKSPPKGKASDFLSRLDVRLDLQQDSLQMTPEEKSEAQIRVAVTMLKKHFGDQVRRVQLAVLDAIGSAKFAGRNRAIDQLIMMSATPADGTFTTAHLPTSELPTELLIDLNVLRARTYGIVWWTTSATLG